MARAIGRVEALYRYPVKSLAGQRSETAGLGWHGIDGDRRLAFRRSDNRSGFPWLTAGTLHELLLFAPVPRAGAHPTHVRTPGGEALPVMGEALATEVGRRYGAPVEMMQLKHGMFDEAVVSVISTDTVNEIARLAGQSPDARRFRPNILLHLSEPLPFGEDPFVGGELHFGDGDHAPAIAVTMCDIRCAMINLDPDTAESAPEMLKAVIRANGNTAGVYGAVTRIGEVAVGQTVRLRHLARQEMRDDATSQTVQSLCAWRASRMNVGINSSVSAFTCIATAILLFSK